MTFRVFGIKIIVKTLIYPGFLFLLSVCFIFLIPTINVFIYAFFILMFSICFPLFSVFVVRRIIINESGIEYRTMFTRTQKSWSDIKFIGVDLYRTRLEGVPLLICFTENYDIDTDEILACSGAFLRVQYRKKIIEEISKYYIGEITGVRQTEEWLKNGVKRRSG
jgi:hypothetical protein